VYISFLELMDVTFDVDIFSTQRDYVPVIISIVSLISNVVLVYVTWRYLAVTKFTARETKNAADATRDAAQVSLLQTLLSVQPILEMRSVDVDYYRMSGTNGKADVNVPIRVIWRVANLGRGTAFDPKFVVRVGDIELLLGEDMLVPSHLDPTDELTLVHYVEANGSGRIAEATIIGETLEKGILRMNCRDSFGSLIETSVVIEFDEHGTRFGSVDRSYDGGPELRIRLQSLLGELLPDVADVSSASG
jgi:hypothetical protein